MPGGSGSKLEVRVRSRATASLVALNGVIDETFEPLEAIPANVRELVLDLDGVRRITSFGVRKWIEGFRLLAPQYLAFVRCRPAIVSQFSMVAGFAAGGQVLSFYAPFLCPSCGKDFEALFDRLAAGGDNLANEPPAANCPDCGVAAELDDVPEAYTAFFRTQERPSPPPAILALLGRDDTTGVRVSKEIAGHLTALWLRGSLDEKVRYGRITDGLEGDVIAIMDGVTAATRESLDAFLHAAQTAGARRIYMSRVSPPVIAALSHGELAKGTSVISAQVQVACKNCHSEGTAEVVSHAAMLTSGTRVCGTCGASAMINPAVDQQELLKIPFTSAPVEVAQYLADHPWGPTGSASPEGAPEDSPVDGLTFGRYKLIKRIGSGGMAEILLARQKGPDAFDRLVALKRIHGHLTKRTSFLQMFLEEARLSARLSHPNIVAIYDVGKVGNRHFIAMEYVRGHDLSTLLNWTMKLHRHIPVPIAVKILVDVCEALGAAHENTDEDGAPVPIIHRDVSPANILLSQGGYVKLSDFGIAKASDAIEVTESGVVKGKLSYLAPERLDRTGLIDARQDIFATGIIMFELLTGTQLFRRDSQEATIDAVLRHHVPRPSSLRPEVAALDAVCLRALDRNLDVRYPTVRELQADLVAAAGRSIASATEIKTWLTKLEADARAAGVADGTALASTEHSEPTRELPVGPNPDGDA